MSIERVSLRLCSATLAAAELEAIVGRAADRSHHRGSLRSSRLPKGPRNEETTVIFEEPGDGEIVRSYLEGLTSALHAIGVARAEGKVFVADLVMLVTARPMGCMTIFEPEDIADLSAAGCGLVVDAYDSDDNE